MEEIGSVALDLMAGDAEVGSWVERRLLMLKFSPLVTAHGESLGGSRKAEMGDAQGTSISAGADSIPVTTAL
jgi:hypothetical protein